MAFAAQLTEEFKAIWKLNKFQAKWEVRAEHPEQLSSEVFYIGGWGFRILIEESDAGKVAAFLERTSYNKCMLHVKSCSLSCIDEEKKWTDPVIYMPLWDGLSTADDKWYPRLTFKCYGWRAFSTAAKLLEHAGRSDDILSITVAVSVERPRVTVDPASCLKMSPVELLRTIPLSNAVTIKGDADCEVKVFEGFLCAHSSVFTAALASDMEEARTRVINVPEAKKQALEDLRDCLLSGGLPPFLVTDWQRMVDLMVLADKYAIAPLTDACLFYLSMMISPKNVSKLLLISDRYGLPRLRKAAMLFAMGNKVNFDAVVTSDEYDVFSADLLRDFNAYTETRKTGEMTVPLMGQWADSPHEFADDTDWQALPRQSLRRACFERLLGTVGTAAELLFRLSTNVKPTGTVEPDAKRLRTSKSE